MMAELSADQTSLEFRDIFAGVLSDPIQAARTDVPGTAYRRSEIEKLIYLPAAELLESPQYSTRTPEDFFKAIEAELRSTSPERRPTPYKMYLRGASTAMNPWDISVIRTKLAATGPNPEDRITFVVIPGVFAGLLNFMPFGDLVGSPKSAFRDLWKRRLIDYKSANPGSDQVTDNVMHLDHLKDASHGLVAEPIDELMSFSSIDDADGKPLANLIVLHTPTLALESVGTLASVTEILNRRLSKVMTIMGEQFPKNIAIVGYSRGAPVVLDMLSTAQRLKTPWLANIKAMISLCGVTYGADIADQAMADPEAPEAPVEAQLYSIATQLVKGQRTYSKADKFGEKMKIVLSNIELWHEALRVATPLLKQLKNPPSENTASGGNKKLGSIMDSLKSAWELGTRQLEMQHPISQYNTNILRFKLVMGDALESVRQLSSQGRLGWWRTNVIPPSVHYYSIAGVMYDAPDAIADLNERAIATNHVAFNYLSPDDKALQFRYTNFRIFKGTELNDSQVSDHRVRFWPEIAQRLNPAQPPYNATFLGVLGTHHWGVSLQAVNSKPGDVANYNPFPRTALLEAFAAQIASDLENNP